MSPKWAEAVVSTGGYWNVSRQYEFMDGSSAVRPLFAAKAFIVPGLWKSSPPPAWGFGGPLMGENPSPAKLRSMLQDLFQLPMLRTQIRPDPMQKQMWAASAPEGWTAVHRQAHVLQLGKGFDAVWSKQFRPDTRNKVKRAEKSGLAVTSGNSAELISEFYSLLRLSFLRWGRRQHEPAILASLRGRWRDPESKLQAMAKAIGPVFRIWIARLNDCPVAGILVLCDREAHYTRGAMDESLAGGTYANYLLHARAIEEACKAGCTVYNMGESGKSASLGLFKTRFGAEEIAYAEYRCERLPISRLDRVMRNSVKQMIGFRDA